MIKNYPLSFSKLASLILCVLTYEMVTNYFLVVVYIIGITHYLVGALYSKGQFQGLSSASRLFLYGCILSGPVLFMIDYTVLMVWVFGVHYMFSEVYVCQKSEGGTNILFWPRFILGTVVYFSTFRNSYNPLDLGDSHYQIVLFAAILVYLYVYSRQWPLRDAFKRDTFVFDSLTAALGVMVLTGGFVPSSNDLFGPSLYHFIFWMFYAAAKPTPGFDLKKYVVQNATVTALVAAGVIGFYVTAAFQNWPKVIYFSTGYSHIMASFLISRLNPRFVVQLFHKA